MDDENEIKPVPNHRERVSLRDYVNTKLEATHDLEIERWRGHTAEHESIARNLIEYKVQSNEWRGSLIDLRSTFVTKSEIDGLLSSAEGTHESILSKIEALDAMADRRFTDVISKIAVEREERRDQQNLRVGQEEGISRSAAFIIGALGVMGTVLGGIAALSMLIGP